MKAVEFNGDGEDCYDGSITVSGLYHLDGKFNDYTICGVTLDSDPLTAGSFKVVDVEAINCPDCVRIIHQCIGVKTACLSDSAESEAQE